jgi:hypothetical protein
MKKHRSAYNLQKFKCEALVLSELGVQAYLETRMIYNQIVGTIRNQKNNIFLNKIIWFCTRSIQMRTRLNVIGPWQSPENFSDQGAN